MKCKFGLLAVFILASCLISMASAGCESCNIKFSPGSYRSGAPDYSKDAYWGMSVEDMKGAVETARSNPDSTVIKYDTMPALVVPTTNSNNFGSLPEITSKFLDSGTNLLGPKSFGKNYFDTDSVYGSLITSGRKPLL